MQFTGQTLGKARSFEEMLSSLRAFPLEQAGLILRTARQTCLFTDGAILTRLLGDERSVLESVCRKLPVGEELLDLRASLPGKVTTEAVRADYVGKGQQLNLVLLEGGGQQVLVEAQSFFTLHRRHPQAVWHFARGRFWLRPIVVLEGKGFFEGRLLGMLNPVRIKGTEMVLGSPRARGIALTLSETEFRYHPCEEDTDGDS